MVVVVVELVVETRVMLVANAVGMVVVAMTIEVSIAMRYRRWQ